MQKIELLKLSRFTYLTTDIDAAMSWSWFDFKSENDGWYLTNRYGVKGYKLEFIPDDKDDPVFGYIGFYDSADNFLGYVFR